MCQVQRFFRNCSLQTVVTSGQRAAYMSFSEIGRDWPKYSNEPGPQGKVQRGEERLKCLSLSLLVPMGLVKSQVYMQTSWCLGRGHILVVECWWWQKKSCCCLSYRNLKKKTHTEIQREVYINKNTQTQLSLSHTRQSWTHSLLHHNNAYIVVCIERS